MGDYPYSDVPTVRKLAGNPDPNDVPDADIAAIIPSGDKHVDAETARAGTGWQSSDPSYPLVVEASQYFNASRIIDLYFDNELKADRHYQKAMDICLTIRESSPSSLIIASAEYRTFPLNPKAPIYRSLPGASSTERTPFGQDEP